MGTRYKRHSVPVYERRLCEASTIYVLQEKGKRRIFLPEGFQFYSSNFNYIAKVSVSNMLFKHDAGLKISLDT